MSRRCNQIHFKASRLTIHSLRTADFPDGKELTEAVIKSHGLCKGAEVPPERLLDFFCFFAALISGKLDKVNSLPTKETLKTSAEDFFAGFLRMTGIEIPNDKIYCVNHDY